MLPILISVSDAPVSYFFCAKADAAATISPESTSAFRAVCLMAFPPFEILSNTLCMVALLRRNTAKARVGHVTTRKTECGIVTIKTLYLEDARAGRKSIFGGCRLPKWVKRRNTVAEQMFSASPPTTDMRRLHRNDRFVPNSRHVGSIPTSGKSGRETCRAI